VRGVLRGIFHSQGRGQAARGAGWGGRQDGLDASPKKRHSRGQEVAAVLFG